MLPAAATATPSCPPLDQAIIGCDIQNAAPGVRAHFPCLWEDWRQYVTRSTFWGPTDKDHPGGGSRALTIFVLMAAERVNRIDEAHMHREGATCVRRDRRFSC